MRRSLTAVVLVALTGCSPQQEPRTRLQISPHEALGNADTAGFARALTPRPFQFPADHGAHLEFRTEWWYVTGNLFTEDNRRFGYQLTIFRNAMAPESPERRSAWASRDTWFAHFALTDVNGNRMHGFERFSRTALGLAGAQAAPFRVWLEDWEIAATGDDFLPLRLRARGGEVALDLELTSQRSLVPQGRDGLSQKSAEPGNASYYYSLSRLDTRGEVTVGQTTARVTGTSWLDREWSTSALGDDQLGWDWFALQLEDGRDLMYYRIRRRDGSTDPLSGGVLVAPDGTQTSLGADEVTLTESSTWQSPNGTTYPSRWRFRVPSASLDVEITPVLEDQEHDFTVRYWEGAVDVRGQGALRGVGYVELTGYE